MSLRTNGCIQQCANNVDCNFIYQCEITVFEYEILIVYALKVFKKLNIKSEQFAKIN